MLVALVLGNICKSFFNFISVLSHDVSRVTEILQMIFTRLGDHRVFRHVFKSLVLLEKLIIVGSAQVR